MQAGPGCCSCATRYFRRYSRQQACEVTQYALAASGPVTRRWNIPRRCPKASSSSRGCLAPITTQTERQRLLHGCASRPRGFPGSTCEARQTDVTYSHVSPPFLSTSFPLPLRTSSREQRGASYQRTSKDKERSCAPPEKRRIRSPQLSRGARFPDAAARPRPAVLGSSFRRALRRASVRVSWSVGFVLTSADSWTPYCSASLQSERPFPSISTFLPLSLFSRSGAAIACVFVAP